MEIILQAGETKYRLGEMEISVMEKIKQRRGYTEGLQGRPHREGDI